MKKGIWILLGFLFPFVAFAQKDSLSIEEITIISKSLQSLPIEHIQTWKDSETTKTLSNNLADFLSKESNVFIKNYGPNTLATSSLAGGNASQTNIYWNGLSINNPMLGLLDLSLLPIHSMENLSVSSIGNSALWGNGSLAGGVYLNNEYREEGLSIKSIYNTINNFSNSLSFNTGNKYFCSSTKVENITGRNNYSYLKINGEEAINRNADVDQWQIMQNLYIPINSKNNIAAHAWYTYSKRGIPPTTQQTIGRDTTQDFNQRYSLQYKYIISDSSTFQTNFGYFIDDNQYNSPSNNTINKVKSFSSTTKYDNTVKKYFRYLIGLDFKNTLANTQAYGTEIVENRIALYSSIQYNREKVLAKLNVRQERINSLFVPFSPSLFIRYKLKSNQSISTEIGRNYRYPALNDIHWRPGGNKDLKAENGWTYSLAYSNKIHLNNWLLEHSHRIYTRTIKDWIMWAKQPVNPFFSAYNIAEVWSRGIDSKIGINYNIDNIDLFVESSYKYTLSTSQKEIELPKITKGEQIWYTPVNQLRNTMGINFQNYQINYIHRFTGKTLGINENLPSYHLHDLQFSIEYNYKYHNLAIQLACNNIFNKQYRVIEYRPMPGRNLSLGINIKIN